MHVNSLHAVIEADVHFTREEIHELVRLSKQHYDGLCKAASQHGGFLYGLDRGMDCDPGVNAVMSWCELDMLAKIAEGENGYRMFPNGTPVRGELGFKIYTIMEQMRTLSNSVNK